MNTQTYNNAVASIRTVAETREAALKLSYQSAMENLTAAVRTAAITGLTKEQEPIGALVSQTIIVGRTDGYPQITIPTETRAVLRAALAAGILASGPNLILGDMRLSYSDLDFLTLIEPKPWDQAYSAYLAWNGFKNGQTWKKL